MPKTYPAILDKDEVSQIVERAFIEHDDYSYTIFSIARKTGKRLGEIYDMQVKDFVPDKKIIYTRILKRRRRVEKETIIDDELVKIINRWITLKKLKPDDYLFHQTSYRNIQNKPIKYAKLCGINKNVSMHSFRHYFITSLVKLGWTYDRIQKLTGHANLSSLSSYDSATSLDLADDCRNALQNL